MSEADALKGSFNGLVDRALRYWFYFETRKNLEVITLLDAYQLSYGSCEECTECYTPDNKLFNFIQSMLEIKTRNAVAGQD